MLHIYLPVAHDIFRTESLTFGELILCLALSSVVFVCVEVEKLLVRRGLIYR